MQAFLFLKVKQSTNNTEKTYSQRGKGKDLVSELHRLHELSANQFKKAPSETLKTFTTESTENTEKIKVITL